MSSSNNYPTVTTKEQWDRYEEDMKSHEERVRKLQPDPRKFGFEPNELEHQGGWTIEGGEQAFRKAVMQWEMMRSMDEPNKPGYYRANND